MTLPQDDRGTERSADSGQGAGPAGPGVGQGRGTERSAAGPVVGQGTSPSQATGQGRGTERSAAGPVVGQGTPPSSGGEPSPAPPAGEAEAGDAGSSKAGAGTADETKVEHDLDALLADTQRERDEYLELAKRTKADFENYRRRMGAEVQAALVRGKAELASGLVGVIDNLERALAAAQIDPDADEPPDEPLAQGFLLTYRELCQALKLAGVESFDPVGEKFDPTWHEALQKLPADGAEPGTVVEVVQKGYRLNDQLIRPARVVVSE